MLNNLMKHPASFLLLLLFLFIGCSGKSLDNTGKESAAKSKLKVGLVFDVGGRGDKSFNDSAYNGLELAKQKHGITFTYLEPQRALAERGILRKHAVCS